MRPRGTPTALGESGFPDRSFFCCCFSASQRRLLLRLALCALADSDAVLAQIAPSPRLALFSWGLVRRSTDRPELRASDPAGFPAHISTSQRNCPVIGMDGADRKGPLTASLLLLLAEACWLMLSAGASPTPPGAAPLDTCTSCGFRRPPEEPGEVDGDFLEAIKRHILNRLQMRDRPNITHAVPKAALVTALRKLHAGKLREDGRVEIPNLDGQANGGPAAHQQVSEIISFAETGGWPASVTPPPSTFPLRPLGPEHPTPPPRNVGPSIPSRPPAILQSHRFPLGAAGLSSVCFLLLLLPCGDPVFPSTAHPVRFPHTGAVLARPIHATPAFCFALPYFPVSDYCHTRLYFFTIWAKFLSHLCNSCSALIYPLQPTCPAPLHSALRPWFLSH